MARLYLFGIGGTGSRVIRSLTMLLSAGVEANGHEIVPIIIDPDRANGDTTRTLDLLSEYQHIQAKVESPGPSFFKNKLSTLREISATPVADGFYFQIDGAHNQKFKDFIDAPGLDGDKANSALVSMLFSEKNLESNLDVGFKGNPNMGSVVLNNFKDSDVFKNFASNFNQDDKIFIISSIFGGTGAAGFPLLLKTLRNAGPEVPNFEWIRNASIGGVSILPYFGVAPDEDSEINKSTFISKTKAALEYYDRTVTSNNSINALYYLGDTVMKDYENHEGAEMQKNSAHLIELLGASAIIDFVNLDSGSHKVINGKAENPIFQECGLKEDQTELHFSTFGPKLSDLLQKPLTMFSLFNLYCDNQLKKSIGKQVWSLKGTVLDVNFIQSPLVRDNILSVLMKYKEWIGELKENSRSFTPINLDVTEGNLYHLVNGLSPRKNLKDWFNSGYAYFDSTLNKVSVEVEQENPAQKFITMFHAATSKIVHDKYKI